MSSAKNCIDIDYCLVKSAANEIKFKRKDSRTVKKFKKLSKVHCHFSGGVSLLLSELLSYHCIYHFSLRRKKKAYLINFLSLFNAR